MNLFEYTGDLATRKGDGWAALFTTAIALWPLAIMPFTEYGPLIALVYWLGLAIYWGIMVRKNHVDIKSEVKTE